MKILMMFLNVLNMYKVVWQNIDIDIPLNDDTYQYYDMPKANLYYNNKLIETYEYYERGINHTNLNVINSRHVKTYKIDYRVNFDAYDISSTQTIHFNIIDNIAPKIIKIPEIKMPVKTKVLTEKNIIENLIYNDNYYEIEELIVKVNGLASVNVNIPNVYELEYEVMDPSYNTTKIIGYYIVENNISPEIKYNDLITINYGETFNYLNHFKFIDDYDKNLNTYVDLSSVNFNKLGSYKIQVTAINNVGLKTTVSSTLEIVDKEKPTLNLKTNNILNVHDYNYYYLKTIILSVYDNYNQLTIDDVLIEGFIDFNVVNKYELTYTVSDSSNNTISKKVVVEIRDLIKPKIESIKDLVFNINETKPNWYNYFLIDDNYDDFSDLTINFAENKINFNNLGMQILEVSVADSSKNKITKIFEINILDLESPEVVQMEEIIVTDFTSKNNEFFKSFFAITDNYDNYIDIKVNISSTIDYEKVGDYDIEIDFIDNSNNITTINTIVYILDIIKPTIKLTTNIIYYYINEEPLNFNNYIMNVNDNKTLKNDLFINIVENINYNKIGKYDVVYEVYDESNNMCSEILSVYVDKTKTKLIEGQDLYIKINEPYILGTNINLSKDVVKTITYPNNINTKKPNTIEVLYIAYDIRGNYEEYIQTVYIMPQNEITKYKTNIIITIIGSVIIVAYYIFEVKNKNNFWQKNIKCYNTFCM